MVKDAKASASLDGASSPPSSSTASPSPVMTASAVVATAAAAAPSSPHAVPYPSPAVLVEALGFVLNQEGLVDFSIKKKLLTVSKDVCDTTRTSILGLSGDERLLPILGKFDRLGYLSITFGEYSSRAWYQTAGVDLSAVAPLLQHLEILTLEKPERGKSKEKKKKKAKIESQSTAGKKKDAEEETGGGGSELIVLDADEVGEEGEASAAAAAGEGAVQDGGFIVDVLLRRIEAPPFKDFGKHLTSVLAASSKKIPIGLSIDPSRYRVDTGRVLILETLLAPERSSAFITALAADAKQIGSVTLLTLLKEVASRGLLGSGGVCGALERQQLAEAVDVLKLAADASPEALCVLRALKGEPVDHLCDVLTRIKIVAVKTK
eukprot:evm.model.NODE_41154_length_22195_cov_27.575174.1